MIDLDFDRQGTNMSQSTCLMIVTVIAHSAI